MVKVLVVDDSVIDLTIIGKTLAEDPNLVVTFCNDSRKALRMAVDQIPDIVLLDLSMPHIDGIRLRELLHDHPATRQCAVIFITGATHGEDIERMFRVGCFEFLPKPIDAETLRETLKHNRIQKLHNEISASINALHMQISCPPNNQTRTTQAL